MARSPLLRRAPPILVLTLLVAGSPIAMSAETRAFTPPPETYETPLKFATHTFSAGCYNTLSCSVVYNNHEFTPYDIGEPAPPPPSADYKDLWGLGGHLDIRNFPPPVKIHWTSLDGTTHEASVDLAEVFKDRLVWHKVPKSDMRRFYDGPVVPGGPKVMVEVNDRTVNVYSAMFIPTRTEQRPGHVNSDYRADRFLVWSRTD